MSLPRQFSTSSGSDAQAAGSFAPIVQTNCDAKASMEELFDVLTQPSSDRVKRWSDRTLPESFYIEPSDSRHGTRSPCGVGARHQSPKRTVGGLQIVHGRSVSSPANLPNSLAVRTTPQHSRQNSCGGFLDSAMSPADLSCDQQQAAWSETTSAKFPRYSADPVLPTDHSSSLIVSQGGVNQNVGVGGRLNASLSVHPGPPADLSSPDSLPLPPGWERAYTAEREPYYIDHNTKSTSWIHPALDQSRNPSLQQFSTQAQRQSPLDAQQHVPQQQQQQAINYAALQFQLQQIQKDKERIRRDQAAVLLREQKLAEMMRSAAISAPSPAAVDPNAMLVGGCSAMTRPMYSNPAAGHDTFQMQNHARQSSGDSGLDRLKAMALHGDDAANMYADPMDFGNFLDSALDTNQLASLSSFGGEIPSDLASVSVCDMDIQSSTGGQTWL